MMSFEKTANFYFISYLLFYSFADGNYGNMEGGQHALKQVDSIHQWNSQQFKIG